MAHLYEDAYSQIGAINVGSNYGNASACLPLLRHCEGKDTTLIADQRDEYEHTAMDTDRAHRVT